MDVVAIIRPERVVVSQDHSEGINVFRGKVVESTFLGNGAEVVVRIGDVDIKSYVSPAVDYPIGTDVVIRIDPESVVLIDEKS
jgi:ABC-type Fe3+/spermidine/putrescine transport system ATPase subunit